MCGDTVSRIGRLPIDVPLGVTVDIRDCEVAVSGPKGKLALNVNSAIEIKKDENKLYISRKSEDRNVRALHGLYRTLIFNNIIGVTEGYSKVLEIVGTGYRVQGNARALEFALGFSHPVKFEAPTGVEFSLDGLKITVSGIDKQLVGEVAANIRKLKPPEPYKGKGIRYVGEHVRRKAGKAGK